MRNSSSMHNALVCEDNKSVETFSTLFLANWHEQFQIAFCQIIGSIKIQMTIRKLT